tara:strand:+ start:173 stop:664 length:492 start_codon:yes stop_codon:yes gene_type:complete
MTASRFLSVLALGFFVAVIIVVIWQIETNFKEQGIASGGPYDNAAAFPTAVIFVIGFLVVIQGALDFIGTKSSAKLKIPPRSALMRAGIMLFIFAVYLSALETIGYHLATSPMIFSIMWICGMRNITMLICAAVFVSTSFAFVFEVFLNVVLPLGIWTIFIPW